MRLISACQELVSFLVNLLQNYVTNSTLKFSTEKHGATLNSLKDTARVGGFIIKEGRMRQNIIPLTKKLKDVSDLELNHEIIGFL